MNHKQIKEHLQNAAHQITPDCYEQIVKEPVRLMTEHDYITRQEQPDKKKINKMKLVSSMAGVLAAFCIMFGIGWYQLAAVDTKIDLDVNPSLTFLTNRQERVIDVRCYNRDAKAVTENLDLNNVKLETAISAVLGSMLQKGYITTEQNTVMLSVQNKDTKKAKELQKVLLEEMNAILGVEKSETKLVSQTLSEDDELKKVAESYHISTGKMKLIRNIQENGTDFSEEELTELSVQKLMELAGKEQMNLHSEMEYEEQDFCGGIHNRKSQSSTQTGENESNTSQNNETQSNTTQNNTVQNNESSNNTVQNSGQGSGRSHHGSGHQ